MAWRSAAKDQRRSKGERGSRWNQPDRYKGTYKGRDEESGLIRGGELKWLKYLKITAAVVVVVGTIWWAIGFTLDMMVSGRIGTARQALHQLRTQTRQFENEHDRRLGYIVMENGSTEVPVGENGSYVVTNQLLKKTDKWGNFEGISLPDVSVRNPALCHLGPYFTEESPIPPNPFNGKRTIRVLDGHDWQPEHVTGEYGWLFYPRSHPERDQIWRLDGTAELPEGIGIQRLQDL